MGEVNLWYCQHVVHINRSQEDWTVEQVITGLCDQFVHSTTMKEARDAYYTARYSTQLSVQGFYDALCDHAQNMSVYPNAYNLMDTFLCGLPKEMRSEMLKNRLMPEANTIKDFVAEGKAIEDATKTMDHYNKQVNLPVARVSTTAALNTRDRTENSPKRAGVTFVRKSDVRGQGRTPPPHDLVHSFNHQDTSQPNQGMITMLINQRRDLGTPQNQLQIKRSRYCASSATNQDTSSVITNQTARSTSEPLTQSRAMARPTVSGKRITPSPYTMNLRPMIMTHPSIAATKWSRSMHTIMIGMNGRLYQNRCSPSNITTKRRTNLN
jgi:hypothetical protein